MQRWWKAATLALLVCAAEAVFASMAFVVSMTLGADAEMVAFSTAAGFVFGAFFVAVIIVGFNAIAKTALDEDDEPALGIGA